MSKLDDCCIKTLEELLLRVKLETEEKVKSFKERHQAEKSPDGSPVLKVNEFEMGALALYSTVGYFIRHMQNNQLFDLPELPPLPTTTTPEPDKNQKG